MQVRHVGDTAAKHGGKTRPINVGGTERSASMVGGTVLALSGAKSLSHGKLFSGIAMIVAGAMFIYRGKTGYCGFYNKIGRSTAGTEDTGVQVERVMTINRARHDVYQFWRNLETLPKFMQHLTSVQITGDKTSHWKACRPGGICIEWDAEIVEDYPGQLVRWHSIGNADIPNEGMVEFRDAPAGRGTEIKVSLRYFPLREKLRKPVSMVASAITTKRLDEDLNRLKQVLETGEMATSKCVVNL